MTITFATRTFACTVYSLINTRSVCFTELPEHPPPPSDTISNLIVSGGQEEGLLDIEPLYEGIGAYAAFTFDTKGD